MALSAELAAIAAKTVAEDEEIILEMALELESDDDDDDDHDAHILRLQRRAAAAAAADMAAASCTKEVPYELSEEQAEMMQASHDHNHTDRKLYMQPELTSLLFDHKV